MGVQSVAMLQRYVTVPKPSGRVLGPLAHFCVFIKKRARFFALYSRRASEQRELLRVERTPPRATLLYVRLVNRLAAGTMSAIRKKVSTRPSCMPPTRRRRTRFGFAFPRGSSSSPSFPPRPGANARHRLPPRRDADGSLAPFSPQQIVKDDGAALSEFEKEVAQVRVGYRAPHTGARSRFSRDRR